MITMIDIAISLASPKVWLGYQRMMDAIAKGEKLSDVLFSLARNYKSSGTANFDLFNGALACLLDSWSHMVGQGVTVTIEDKRVENFMNGSRARMLCDLSQAEISDMDLFEEFIASLCYGVNYTRESIRFLVVKPAPVADKPLNVNIVSQPSMVAVQEFVRDNDMEIVRSVSTSKPLNSAVPV
jgi:hypothetical protein